MRCAFPDDAFALFDADDGGALLLTGYRHSLSFSGAGDAAPFFAELEAAVAQGAWLALAADYELAGCLEPAAPPMRPHPDHASPLRAHLFSAAHWLDEHAVAGFLHARVSALPDDAQVAGIAELQLQIDGATHAAAIEQIRAWIADGECYQVNYTFPLAGRLYGSPLALYARLRARQPVRYGGFVHVPGETLISLSPELFFERQGRRVVTRPMKGTAPRGLTPEADVAQRDALLASPKERAENIMIVDLLRSDLGRLAATGAVRVEALCAAEAYPTLWQMVSTISAEVPEASLYALFRALFPCGSVTGAPKIAAMHKIAALEAEPRGIYTGALGWCAPGGDCRFNVAIRTLDCRPDGRVRLGVGSGVVMDAEAGREWAECLLKADFLSGADPGFALIETMRLDQGACPLLDLHLDRLASSAAALGFVCDVPAVRTAVAAQAAQHQSGVHRLRLTLAHTGAINLASTPLLEHPAPGCAVFSDERLDSRDILLRHKTTARCRYDRALAALAETPEVFDAVFLNERGEVCEGARSTVFVERDGRLLTPPLRCGLLPGVLRRQMLERGQAIEAVLYPDDLRAAPFYLGNALRGLLRVSVRG